MKVLVKKVDIMLECVEVENELVSVYKLDEFVYIIDFW